MRLKKGVVYFYDEDNNKLAHRAYNSFHHSRNWAIAYIISHLKRKNKARVHYIQIYSSTNDNKISPLGRNING